MKNSTALITVLLASVVVLFLLPYSLGSSSFSEIREILLDSDAEKVAELEGEINTCRTQQNNRLTEQQNHKTNTLKPLRGEVASLNSSLQTVKDDINHELDRLEKRENVIGEEKQLVQTLLDMVDQLNNEEKKTAITGLLNDILERMQSESYLNKRRELMHASSVKPLVEKKNNWDTQLETKRDQLSSAEQWQIQLVQMYNTKKTECDGLSQDLEDMLTRFQNNYGALREPSYDVPEGRKRVVGQFVTPGKIRTFDGLEYSIPKSENGADYVLVRTQDQTLTVVARTLPLISSVEEADNTTSDQNETQITGHTLSEASIEVNLPPHGKKKISVNPDLTVTVGEGMVNLPYYSPAISVEKNEEGSMYIELPAGILIMIHTHTSGNGKDISVVLPRSVYYGLSRGLFGVFDDDHFNDLTLPDNTYATSEDEIPEFIYLWNMDSSYFPFTHHMPSVTEEERKLTMELNPEDINLRKQEASAEYEAFLRTSNLEGSGTVCRATGDPHYTTFDGHRHDMYDVGAYHLVKSLSGTMDVQTQTDERAPWNGASVNIGAAARVHGDIVVITLNDFLINGESGINIPNQGLTLPGGGLITVSGSTYEVTWRDGSVLTVTVRSRLVNVWMFVPNTRFNTLHPTTLCGGFDLNSGNDASLNMDEDPRVSGKSLFQLGGITESSSSSKSTSSSSSSSGDNFANPTTPENPHWDEGEGLCRSIEVPKCEKSKLDDNDVNNCVVDWLLSHGNNEIIREIYLDKIQEDCRLDRELVNTDPIVHLTFNTPFNETPQAFTSDGAHIDLEHNHLKLPELSDQARYELDHAIEHGDISIAFWLNVGDVNQESEQILMRHASDEQEHWNIALTDTGDISKYRLSFNTHTKNGVDSVSMDIPKRTWVNIVASINGMKKKVHLYRNRDPVVNKDISGGFVNVTSTSQIQFGVGSYVATLKDFRVYEIAVRQMHVNNIYDDGYRHYAGETAVMASFMSELEDSIEHRTFRFNNETIPNMRDTKQSYQSALGVLENEKQEYQIMKQTHVNNKTQIEGQIETVRGEYNLLEEEKQQINRTCLQEYLDQKRLFQSEIETIESTQDFLNQHQDIRQNLNFTSFSESEKIQQLLSDMKAKIEDSIDDIEKEIAACRDDIGDVEGRMASLQDEIDLLQSKANAIQADIQILKNNIEEVQSDISNKETDIQDQEKTISNAQTSHANWVQQQRDIINQIDTVLQDSTHMWKDSGMYVVSGMVNYAYQDSVAMLNLFEYLHIEDISDYIPIVSRIRYSSSDLKASSISSPLRSDFSVVMNTETWKGVRPEVNQLLVIGCKDKTCNEVQGVMHLDVSNRLLVCDSDHLMPDDLYSDHLLTMAESCMHLNNENSVRIGVDNNPTRIIAGSTEAVKKRWMEPDQTFEKVVIFGHVNRQLPE
eukprot:gb/GECH01011247.1/.p1 GENE.gb/GECH01011247.1/~~gb/GECH01011247.1/.p1  ORF type:complete len:1406 (+),score=323.11 gb/GECH01011247.1/:1-4218(+)